MYDYYSLKIFLKIHFLNGYLIIISKKMMFESLDETGG